VVGVEVCGEVRVVGGRFEGMLFFGVWWCCDFYEREKR
jgi:hypothetical protein